MSKLYELPDLKQLKEWKTYDQEGFNSLIKILSKHKKILILATKDSGKNTFQNSIVNYIHRSHRETLVLPSIEGIRLKKVKSHKKINEYKKFCKSQKSYVACFQHSSFSEEDINNHLIEFSSWFDCVLDLRNIEGQRILFAIYEGNKNLKCTYQNKKSKHKQIAA